jgi:HK97 family phage major capsid protein
VSGGFTVSRRAETASQNATRMQMEQVTLQANSLFGFSYATEELLTDSPISFAAIVEAGFRDQFAAHLLNEKINGNGDSEYRGILNCGATVSQAKESNQIANTIVTANVTKMRSRCWGYGNAVWVANHDTYPQLSTLSVGVGTGGSLVYQNSVVEDRPDMLLGRPIFYTEWAATLGTVGDIMLLNMSQYLEGTYQPLQSAESIHVRFLNHERAFKFWTRNAADAWWRTALTPAKSSITLSPFVTLATRA